MFPLVSRLNKQSPALETCWSSLTIMNVTCGRNQPSVYINSTPTKSIKPQLSLTSCPHTVLYTCLKWSSTNQKTKICVTSTIWQRHGVTVHDQPEESRNGLWCQTHQRSKLNQTNTHGTTTSARLYTMQQLVQDNYNVCMPERCKHTPCFICTYRGICVQSFQPDAHSTDPIPCNTQHHFQLCDTFVDFW